MSVAHVNSSFNNTVVTITISKAMLFLGLHQVLWDLKVQKINSLCCSTCSRGCWKKASEHGVKTVDIQVQGPGSGRGICFKSTTNDWLPS